MRTKSSTSAKFGTSRYKAERRVDQLMRSEQTRPVSPAGSARSFHSLPASPPTGTKPSISQFLVREDSGTRSITPLTPSTSSLSEYAPSTVESDASTVKETETIPSTVELQNPQDQTAELKEDITNDEISHAPVQAPSIREPSPERPSEATERPISTVYSDAGSQAMPELTEQVTVPERPKPDLDEPFDFSYLEAKPKVKLGPRPVAATEKHRKSGGNLGTSLLPAAYRSSKKQEQQRPSSTTPGGFLQPNQLNFPAPPPIPDVPEYNPRPISRGSVKSMPSQKSTTMTPEKLRLMKAVELRKKQMRKSNPQVKTPMVVDDAPEVPQVPVSTQEPPSQPIAQHIQPGSELAASRETTSNSNVENDNGPEVGSEDPATLTPSSKPQEEALAQPPGLLASPSGVQDIAPQETSSAPQIEVEGKSQDAATEDHQRAGAVDSATPSPKTLEHDMLPKTATIPDEEHQQTQASAEQANATTLNAQTKAVNQNIDETAFSTSVENLITDVPAIVTTASSRPQTAEAATQREDFALESRDPSSMESSGTLPTPSEETLKQMSDLAKRRRGLVEPLHIDVDTRRNSVADSLSDNELFEELQTATFHDAREMSVSKSPGPNTPFFPPNLGRSPSRDSAASNSRSPVRAISITNGVSQPAQDVSPDQQLQQRAERDISVSPEPAQQPLSGLSSHSISPIDRNTPSPSLKRNVSSGITRRIQALNEMSSRETNTVPVHIPTRAMSPDQASMLLSNDRKPTLRSPHSRSGSAFRMRPHAERTGSSSPAVQQLESPPVWNTTHDNTSNRDSVSVKARIVRPNTAGSTERSGEKTADLHESQIEINHLRGVPTPTAVSQAFLPPMPSPPVEPTSPDHRSLHSLRRKSLGRTRASNPGPTPANELQPGSASIASTEEHGGSRTSRFFKRMSNFGGGSSKRRSLIGASTVSVASPNPTETSASRAGSVAATSPPTAPAPALANLDRDTPPAVQVGDLNVQFPDTLVSPLQPNPHQTPPPKKNLTNPSPALETPLALPRRNRPPAPLPAHLAANHPARRPAAPGQEVPPLGVQGALRARPRPPGARAQHLPRVRWQGKGGRGERGRGRGLRGRRLAAGVRGRDGPEAGAEVAGGVLEELGRGGGELRLR